MPGLAAREAAWLASRQAHSAPRRQQAQAAQRRLVQTSGTVVMGWWQPSCTRGGASTL